MSGIYTCLSQTTTAVLSVEPSSLIGVASQVLLFSLQRRQQLQQQAARPNAAAIAPPTAETQLHVVPIARAVAVYIVRG